MKKLIPFTLVALVIASCDDRPSTPPKQRFADTTTWIDPNIPRRSAAAVPTGPVILKSFHAVVLAKHEKCFEVQGLSGQKYLIFPSQDLVTRPPDATGRVINYSQVNVGDRLTLRLSWKIPHAAVYICEWVELHGVKLPNGFDTTPRDPLRDD